jgi:hypothetical protein
MDDFPPFLVHYFFCTRAISFRLVSTDRLYLGDLPPAECSLYILLLPNLTALLLFLKLNDLPQVVSKLNIEVLQFSGFICPFSQVY